MSAKDIVLRPISAKDANALVRRFHYSGKVVNNSQLHIGVFYQGQLEGAMQFGPSLDKRKIMGLVEGTGWNEFIELNRMAFSDVLPRNSESRALSVAMKLIRKHAPHIRWVVTFADGAQCGDGTIYRAAGFVLTGIKVNNQIWSAPDGETATRSVLTDTRRPARTRELDRIARSSFTMLGNNGATLPRRAVVNRVSQTKGSNIIETGGASMQPFIEAGYKPIPGFQLRYIYFIDPSCRERLTVPVLPYSEIDRRGAGMYRGEPRARSVDSDAPANHAGEGGAVPTLALQEQEAAP
jgi:hypothetical protein